MENNRDAVAVWGECKTQLIVGFGGAIDINLLAVKMIMDLYKITNQQDCLWRVRVMSDEYLKIVAEKQKERDAKS
ncbi:MAG: hypothetical protein A4E65_02316 [Syntrophorhabdus sp. PtaU1.Bin153]|nr:MAG: hypothetical protein A4E65_02316 [Syntrophorhabdus sp. PtaU1.Bin153]